MKKVLIVEDEIAYLKILSSELSKKGHEVIEATDGKKGLLMAKRENPDIIILDIRMPKMNGMDMLKELRKTEKGKKTKVIMLTNLEPDDKIINGIIRDHPIYYFVKSNIQLKNLVNKVQELLAN